MMLEAFIAPILVFFAKLSFFQKKAEKKESGLLKARPLGYLTI